MKIAVLNGSPRTYGNTATLVESFKKGAETAGHEVDVLQIGIMNIRGCIACECCRTKTIGECAIKDDMQNVYDLIKTADMIVFASAVYYWSFTGQMQSTITRFYALGKPKAQKYGLILSSGSADVYDAILSQYHDILNFFGAIDMGTVTAYGSQNKTEEKLSEAYKFGSRL